MDKCAAAACAELSSRFTHVRAGVDVGFGDVTVSQTLRAACPGVWMTVEDGIFSVDEVGGTTGFSQRGVYELLKDGFDVVGLKRPPWWKFGAAGRTLTVCARRKTWRRRSAPIVGAAMPVSSAMLSPRERKGGVR